MFVEQFSLLTLIMLVGTEADVIFIELGFTASQHFSCHMDSYPNLTVSGQAFLGQFTSTIVFILTRKITCRHLNSTIFIQKWFISIENTTVNKIHANAL